MTHRSCVHQHCLAYRVAPLMQTAQLMPLPVAVNRPCERWRCVSSALWMRSWAFPEPASSAAVSVSERQLQLQASLHQPLLVQATRLQSAQLEVGLGLELAGRLQQAILLRQVTARLPVAKGRIQRQLRRHRAVTGTSGSQSSAQAQRLHCRPPVPEPTPHCLLRLLLLH